MYEKEIARLQARLTGADDTDLDVAIALMRAAEPRDEEAEELHCTIVAADFIEDEAKEVFMRERAQASADGYAAANRDLSTYRESCQDELLAAQTEIERLRNENKQLVDQEVGQSMDCAAHERTIRKEFEEELAAARERIIALETGQDAFEDSSQDELQAKLTNLRTAAAAAIKVLVDFASAPEAAAYKQL